MKKALSLIMSILMILTAFTACGDSGDTNTKENEKETDETVSTTQAEDTPEEETVTVWLIDEVTYASSVQRYLYDDNNCFIGIEKIYPDGSKEQTTYPDYKYDENGNPLHFQYDAVVKYTEKYNEFSDIIERVQIFEDYNFETGESTENTTVVRYEYEYDINNRPLKKTEIIPGTMHVETTYTYNENGDILRETVINEDLEYVTEYTYDENGTVTMIKNWFNTEKYILDDEGKVIRVDYINDSGEVYYSENYQYDEEGNYVITGSGQRQGFDKHGNVISLAYENTEYANEISISYKAVEVTPIRAKAIERHKDAVFYGLYQR